MSDAPLRALPRVFIPGADLSGPVELPEDELTKLRKVLRLATGDLIALLPGDGSVWRCRLEGRRALPLGAEWPVTEPELRIVLAQALPKGDRLETVIRMGTELGVAGFVVFPSERSVVRWEPAKLESKLRRLSAIAREAAEQSYRTRLPNLEALADLESVLSRFPEAIVLSESEGEGRTLVEATEALVAAGANTAELVVGPEGGWSPRELERIGSRGATLGPLVLRTDTAGPAAVAAIWLGAYAALRRNSPSS